jgi:hypothetical protein
MVVEHVKNVKANGEGEKVPCNTLTQVTLELKNANLDWLEKALKQLGYEPVRTRNGLAWRGGSYNQKTGELTSRNAEEVNRIKRAYSCELVKHNASRFGWKVKMTGINKFQIQKG